MSLLDELKQKLFNKISPEGPEKNILERIEDGIRISRWISLACLASTFIYVFLLEVLHRVVAFKPIFPPTEKFTFRIVLGSFAILSTISAVVFQKLGHNIPKTADLPKALNRLTSFHMICVGIGEQPIIFGLLLYLFEGRYLDFYVFFALTIGLQLRFFPNREAWIATLRNVATTS